MLSWVTLTPSQLSLGAMALLPRRSCCLRYISGTSCMRVWTPLSPSGDEISGKRRCCGKRGAMILSIKKQAARLTSLPGRQNGQKRKVERLEREFAAKRLGVLWDSVSCWDLSPFLFTCKDHLRKNIILGLAFLESWFSGHILGLIAALAFPNQPSDLFISIFNHCVCACTMYTRILYQQKVAAKVHHCWLKFQNACETNISCWVVSELWSFVSLADCFVHTSHQKLVKSMNSVWDLGYQSVALLPHKSVTHFFWCLHLFPYGAQICNRVRYAAPAMNSELWGWSFEVDRNKGMGAPYCNRPTAVNPHCFWSWKLTNHCHCVGPVLVLHEDSLRGSQVDWRYAIFCVKLWLRKSLVGGSNTVAAMFLRILLPLLLQWTAGEVQIPTVEIAKGVQMPVMSIGLPQVMFCTFRASANSIELVEEQKNISMSAHTVPFLVRHWWIGKVECISHCCELDQAGWKRNWHSRALSCPILSNSPVLQATSCPPCHLNDCGVDTFIFSKPYFCATLCHICVFSPLGVRHWCIATRAWFQRHGLELHRRNCHGLGIARSWLKPASIARMCLSQPSDLAVICGGCTESWICGFRFQRILRIPGCTGTKLSVEYDLKQLQTAARSERAEGFDPQDPGCSFW